MSIFSGCKSVLELEMPADPPESTKISGTIKTDGDLSLGPGLRVIVCVKHHKTHQNYGYFKGQNTASWSAIDQILIECPFSVCQPKFHIVFYSISTSWTHLWLFGQLSMLNWHQTVNERDLISCSAYRNQCMRRKDGRDQSKQTTRSKWHPMLF